MTYWTSTFRVPAYSDWFMKGVTTVRVTNHGKKWVYVEDTLGRPGGKWKVEADYFRDHYEPN